jgi:nitroimidazol reductase NimA-like FMN-containing flavoprotein (pyridoxamine 5'-phosphate oxidase superfamily)
MLGELTRQQSEDLLRHEVIGRIGCHADGRTYVVPVTYVFDDGSIWGHTAEGTKVQMMRKNPRVCFEVDHMEDMANWQSVIVTGRFEELHGDAVGTTMNRLMRKLMPLITSETSVPSHGLGPHGASSTSTTVGPAGSPHGGASAIHAVTYRIVVEDMTGRFEKR